MLGFLLITNTTKQANTFLASEMYQGQVVELSFDSSENPLQCAAMYFYLHRY